MAETVPRPRAPFSPGLIFSLLLIAIFVGVVATLAMRALGLGGQRALFDPDAEPRAVTARGDLAASEMATVELFRQSSPSVVHINTARLGYDLRQDLVEIPEGAGSGIVWDREGHVVTNAHVVLEASFVRVTLTDHSTWQAQVVGVDLDYDLAVLRIQAPPEKLRPVPLGVSRKLLVGQTVFAIGNPFGLDQTLTKGVISGLGRQITALSGNVIRGAIQTDAAINPGNSGGALLDSAGRLIGVNTAILSRSGSSSGVGFAVPVDVVNRVVPYLLRNERVARPGLGVTITDAAPFGLEGVALRGVQRGSAAERAGLRPMEPRLDDDVALGDVIVGLDGKPIRNEEDLRARLEQYAVGDEVELELRRGEGIERVAVTLQAIP